MKSALRHGLQLVGVATAYFLAGKLGLALVIANDNATPAWFPSGIASGAFLVLGARVWPAIAVAAFLLNFSTSYLFLSSSMIATGNTLGGLTFLFLVSRYSRSDATFRRVDSVARFAVCALLSAIVSALFGVAALRLVGLVGAEDQLTVALTWLLGDFTGIVIAGPFIALWLTGAPWRWSPSRTVEFAAVLAGTGITSWCIFGNSPIGLSHYPIPFLVLPVLLWPAFRLGARETVATTLLLSVIGITGSTMSLGPFVRDDVDESVFLVQLFFVVCGLGALAVAAEVGRREAVEAEVRALNEELEHRVSVRAQELVRAHARLRRTRVRHAAAMRGVHARIASDLHDSVGASLSRIAILSDLALRESESSATATTGALTKIGDNARAVIDEMSDAVWFVDPKMEDIQQMVVRLRIVAAALFDSNGTDWDIDAAPELLPLTLTADQRRHLFLILKEALTNVHRHAHATMVRVVITATESGLRAVVDDNGTGMLAEHTGPGHGNGLSNMQKRAIELAGTLSIQSRPAIDGTRIIVDVPLRS